MGKVMQTNIHEAKAKLSQLVELAANGEDVVIAKAGKPVARLVRYEAATGPRPIGLLKGQVVIAPDFDAENEEINSMFYGDGQ